MSITIFSLPLEIRDMIYRFSLSQDQPIVVWKGRPVCSVIEQKPNAAGQHGPPTLVWDLQIDRCATAASLQGLTLGLLRASRQIAFEAAEAFYNNNTFSFLGRHNWHPIAPWLEIIGQRNRGYLTKIIIEVGQLPRAYQLPNGIRVKAGQHPYTLYQRSRHLQLSLPATEGTIENINYPGVYSVFRALSTYTGPERKIELTIQLWDGLLPGLQLDFDEEQPAWDWFTMDLPNLIEIFRIEAKTESPNRKVDIVWKGTLTKYNFTGGRSLIRQTGWDILEERETKIVRAEYEREARRTLPLLIEFRLRRLPILPNLLIIAGECNPHL